MPKTQFIVEPGVQQVVMTRDFDAPRELVFRVLTDPELVGRWWGPSDLTTDIQQMDMREGGAWRFVQHDKDGNAFAFHGIYHVVDAPRQVVQTFEFDGLPERHVLLETLDLDEKDGVTTLTQTSVYQSVTDRDGMVAMGMESGATESLERLAALLQSERVDS
jgi:uncharacterized protein YndB with AHSA1/START domain